MSIFFKLTDAGLAAALSEVDTGLKLRLTQIAIGTGKYVPAASRTALANETARFPLMGGDVEPNSKTLRFSAILESLSTLDAFEIGLFDEHGVLFGVASTTGADPLIKVTANIAFIGAFAMSLAQLPDSSVTLVLDPNSPLSIVLMNQHLAAPDPHPQYAFDSDLATEAEARRQGDIDAENYAHNEDVALAQAFQAKINIEHQHHIDGDHDLQLQINELRNLLYSFIGAAGNGDYLPGVYTIPIYPGASKKITLFGGGAGGGSSYHSSASGTNGIAGTDTFFSLSTGGSARAYGGAAGTAGVWGNGSSYTNGEGGVGGATYSDFTILDSANGATGVATRESQAGGNSGHQSGYGQGGNGGGGTGDEGWSYGGGGGEGARLVVQVTNSTTAVQNITLTVGIKGAGGTVDYPSWQPGSAGQDGHAIVESA